MDGDTLIVRVHGARERVRLIGIDTPETVKPGTPVQCFGPQSSAYLQRLLQSEDVVLAYDAERLDRYGRTLAYVYRARDRLFVNLDLVARGYARTLSIPPDIAHERAFASAARTARAARLGLWGACE